MPGQNKPTQTLRPLLPAPRALQPLPPRLPPASSKKRLIPSTKVACNACRSKKKACDGKRPACTPCTELGTQCVYISANETETAAMALKRENQMLRDMLSQLTAMPEDVAHQTLKKLKFAVDPFSAFRTIRPSAPKDVREVLPHVHSDIEFELTRRHPSVYPQIRRLSRSDVLESAASRPAKVARIASSSGESRSVPDDGRDRDMAEVTSYNPNFASDVGTRPYSTAFFVSPTGPSPPPPPPVRKDPRLRKLSIGFWTVVPITNQDAADAISIYLETDHPVLGLFDADLFLDDLIGGEVRYCSSLLVNALLAFACQAYAAKNPEASRWSQEFEEEANKLWLVQNDDTLPTIAALAFLIQSCGCNGNGELDVRYIKETAAMAKRLKLFGCPDAYTFADLSHLSEAKARATAQTAWGVFDTLSMISQYYLPATTEYPPRLPIPGSGGLRGSEIGVELAQSSRESSAGTSSDLDTCPRPRSHLKRGRSSSLTWPVSDIFAPLCELWKISSQITWVYQHDSSLGHSSRAFALEKYSKLLVWADNLPESMKRCEHSPYQVLVCHIWFHGTVLYLLRPFIPSDQQHGFRSWSPSADRIHAFFAASIEQLKELAELYASCPQSTYSIFGHPALLHVANAVASDIGNPEWRIYFMSCIRAYQALYSSFTVAEVIAGGLLSMVVRKGAMDTAEAFGLLQELRAKKRQKLVGRATGMFVTDFDLAVTDREAARADRMMEKFEEMTILDEFTHGVI
ncbi:Nitrogen assimilation transcription factor nit-4 [Colletotrichum higginsianum]|nr:Nitrogen assimilation transcription factor nit-4 [Colletotrichum higginsianum]